MGKYKQKGGLVILANWFLNLSKRKSTPDLLQNFAKFSWQISQSFLSSSVQFSHSVMSDSLWPHQSQHTRPPCPSPTFGVYPNSCPLSQWCHSTISSSVVPFSPCPQSFPASGSFPMSQHFWYYLVHSLTCLLSISYEFNVNTVRR